MFLTKRVMLFGALCLSVTVDAAAQVHVRTALSGVVREQNRDPLAGVSVSVGLSGDAERLMLTTDKYGYFSIDALADGGYDVEASFPGFLSVCYRAVRVVFPTASKIDFVLPISVVGGDAIYGSSELVGRLKIGTMIESGMGICLTSVSGSGPFCTNINRLGQYFLEVPRGAYTAVLKVHGEERHFKLNLSPAGQYRDVVVLE